MSKENVVRFVADVKSSEQLQAELQDKVEISAVVKVANRHGYQFTEDDVQAYSADQKAALTEEQLEAVAGGLVRDPFDFPRIPSLRIVLF